MNARQGPAAAAVAQLLDKEFGELRRRGAVTVMSGPVAPDDWHFTLVPKREDAARISIFVEEGSNVILEVGDGALSIEYLTGDPVRFLPRLSEHLRAIRDGGMTERRDPGSGKGVVGEFRVDHEVLVAATNVLNIGRARSHWPACRYLPTARQDGAAGWSGRSVRVAGDAAHVAWVAGRGPAEPHTEVADHGGGYAGHCCAGRAQVLDQAGRGEGGRDSRRAHAGPRSRRGDRGARRMAGRACLPGGRADAPHAHSPTTTDDEPTSSL